jgi:hypothetical protein
MDLGRFTPRFLGNMFVIVAFLSLLSGLLLSSLSIPILGSLGNLSQIMNMVSSNLGKMHISILVMFIEAAGIVLLAALLYSILKEQNRIIALWALGLWILEAIILVIRAIFAFSLLNVSQEFMKAGDPSYLKVLGSLFSTLMQFSYVSLMVFYCIGGFFFYYLFFKSRYIPRAVSIIGMAAVFIGLAGIILIIFGLYIPIYVFLPILLFELLIGIWLMAAGIKDPNTKL